MTSLRRTWLLRLGLSALVTLWCAAARSDDDVDALSVNAGLGISFPADDSVNGQKVEGRGNGGWVAVEYAYRDIDWFTPRTYAGGIVTVPAGNCGPMVSPCDVSAKLFFFGAKLRLQVPIPYVAPYLESGSGLSIGSVTTRIGNQISLADEGIMFHIPVGLGLALGERHQYEVSFQYLFHPWGGQVAGAAALGLRFPLPH